MSKQPESPHNQDHDVPSTSVDLMGGGRRSDLLTAVGAIHLLVATGCGLWTVWVIWGCLKFIFSASPPEPDWFRAIWSILEFIVGAIALLVGWLGGCLTVLGFLAAWAVLSQRRCGRWLTLLVGSLWVLVSTGVALVLGSSELSPPVLSVVLVVWVSVYGVAACIITLTPRLARAFYTGRGVSPN